MSSSLMHCGSKGVSLDVEIESFDGLDVGSGHPAMRDLDDFYVFVHWMHWFHCWIEWNQDIWCRPPLVLR